MELHWIRKFTLIINSVILALVFGLMAFFWMCGATILVWFSIPTTLIYLIGYYLVLTGRYDIYVRMVYTWLTIYMGLTTICLGNAFCFQLYSLSMIPIIFYTEYMAHKMKRATVSGTLVSLLIVFIYVVCSGYNLFYDPVYKVDEVYSIVFWIVNSLTVFSFLIFYSRFLVTMIISSEEKLTDMALKDRLTGLYNRHYIISCLEKVHEDAEAYVAIADIDDFKKINDNYGHNAGDYVLAHMAELMRKIFTEQTVSRWGGEEFLILSENSADPGILEKFRQTVEKEEFVFEGEKISVSVTVGYAPRQGEDSIDSWVQAADGKLYEGKKSGKNRVIG